MEAAFALVAERLRAGASVDSHGRGRSHGLDVLVVPHALLTLPIVQNQHHSQNTI